MRSDVAGLEGRPDFTVGLDYIVTDEAMDSSIAESGDDPILLSFGITLPIWREKYDAGVREALAGGWRSRTSEPTRQPHRRGDPAGVVRAHRRRSARAAVRGHAHPESRGVAPRVACRLPSGRDGLSRSAGHGAHAAGVRPRRRAGAGGPRAGRSRGSTARRPDRADESRRRTKTTRGNAMKRFVRILACRAGVGLEAHVGGHRRAADPRGARHRYRIGVPGAAAGAETSKPPRPRPSERRPRMYTCSMHPSVRLPTRTRSARSASWTSSRSRRRRRGQRARLSLSEAAAAPAGSRPAGRAVLPHRRSTRSTAR